jgi:hypothetical protein
MRSSAVRWLALVVGAFLVAAVVACGLTGLGPRQLLSIRPGSGPPHKHVTHEPSEPPAPGTGTSKPEDLFQVFADAPPLKSGQFHPADLERIFPAFQHKPFATAGFNAVMLPFTYSDPQHLGDASEAMALTALISNDLDWSPGCYCGRHAYFVFKRDREAVQALLQGYDPGQVAAFARNWQATHAIGGQLIRTAAGYEGKLQIFDAQGRPILTKEYEPARSFWDLLGDMDVDAMTALDGKPSMQLAGYLHEPRCTKFQSVVELGSAALMEERSPQEFGTYQSILRADPGFAMVRHWYANQKHWHDGDDGYWERQNALALASRIEPASLEEFTAALCPDKALAAKLPQWLDRAEALASPDSPTIMDCRFRNECYGSGSGSGSGSAAQLVERALKVAERYPNSHHLLVTLGLRVRDRFLAASLFTASLRDRSLTGTGVKDDEMYDLAWMAHQIGRDDVTMELLSVMGPQQAKYHFDLLLEALCRGGRYAEAADLYPLLDSSTVGKNARLEMAPHAAFAAVIGNKVDLFNQILRDQSDIFAEEHLTNVFQLFSDAAAGKHRQFLIPTNYVDYPGMWRLFLVAAIDALHGKSTYHGLMTEAVFQWPMNRLLWIAEDNYQRRDPSHDAAAFYDYLEMFFDFDPWVKSAVADFHKRGGADKPIDLALLRADLNQAMHDDPYPSNLAALDWKHVLTPWRVAACVHQLLTQHKPRDAQDIARLYDLYQSKVNNPWQNAIAGELVRKANATPLD